MVHKLVGMGGIFVSALLVGLGGSIIFPGLWQFAFATLAGISSLGLGLTGYAIGINYRND